LEFFNWILGFGIWNFLIGSWVLEFGFYLFGSWVLEFGFFISICSLGASNNHSLN